MMVNRNKVGFGGYPLPEMESANRGAIVRAGKQSPGKQSRLLRSLRAGFSICAMSAMPSSRSSGFRSDSVTKTRSAHSPEP
jgi:hypothetical protein